MGFKTQDNAQAHVKKVLAILGDKWTGRVWHNHGCWHAAWQWGSVTLYYEVYGNYYHALVGEPGGCGGHMDLTTDNRQADDPIAAIKLACDAAIEAIEQQWKPIMTSVSVVRLSLGAV